MQTPTMNINAQSLGVCREQKISPIYPLKSNEENRGATPLARQMFEKKMVEQRRSLEQNSPDGDTLMGGLVTVKQIICLFFILEFF